VPKELSETKAKNFMTDIAVPTKSWLPLILLLILGALWGGSPSFAKAASMQGLHPVGAVFWQTLWAGLILTAICVLRGVPIRIDGKHLAYYSVVGGMGMSTAWVVLVYVSGAISAGYGAVIVLLSPVLTYIFAVTIRIEQVKPLRVLGIMLGLIGAAFLVVPDGSLPLPGLWPVALLGLATPLAYAMSNVYIQWGRPTNGDTFALAAGTMFAVALVTGVIGLTGGHLYPIWVDFGMRDAPVLLWGTSTAAAFYVYFRLVHVAGAVYMAQVGYVATILGVLWGVALFGETVPIWMGVAALLVGVGVSLVNYRGKTSR
jgi:drug/metabolite transporter (DMT)-like permease